MYIISHRLQLLLFMNINSIEDITAYIYSKGGRITLIRKMILEILLEAKSPLSSQDILTIIVASGYKPNKTTIYREVDFLLSIHLIRELEVGDSSKRYELCNRAPHLHSFCTACGEVACIDTKVSLNSSVLEKLSKSGFSASSTNTVVQGTCKGCR